MANPGRASILRPLARLFVQQSRSYSAPGSGEIPQAKLKYVPTSGSYPAGFSVGTSHAGVKASNTKNDDITLITSDRPCAAAAVFTTNRFQAAPVQACKELLAARAGSGVRGLVVNSGCANAVTGRGGLDDAWQMVHAADATVDNHAAAPASATSLVMSTGVIGQRLPLDRILPAIPRAAAAAGTSHDHYLRAAKAICTTDTFPKLLSRTFTLPSHPGTSFTLAGMTKGAGMIHPNMATLLGIMLTDAPVAPSALAPILTNAAARSFNAISIDGDTSTNDTLALLANGAAAQSGALYRSSPREIADADSEDGAALEAAVTALATELAQLVVRDGEGATKFVTLRVTGPQHRSIRHRVAATIARSPLVKTALYGKDANWGRVLCAVGYTEGLPEGSIDPAKVSVSFVSGAAPGGELKLLVDGEPVEGGVDEAVAAKVLAEEDLEILVSLGEGGGEEVKYWTCDFSHEYVTINGDYRT